MNLLIWIDNLLQMISKLCQRRMPLPLSRRQMLMGAATGFGSLALRSIMAEEAMANIHDSQNGLPHFVSRAKRVIFLFMHGGPSHIDTFDHKPLLKRDHGKPLPFAKPECSLRRQGTFWPVPGNSSSMDKVVTG